MTKLYYLFLLVIQLLSQGLSAQSCEITSVTPVALPCQGSSFLVTVDLEVSNPTSPGFTLAGNGVIYGTFLYDDLPVTVGPLLGDDESEYEFIAWDVENADCQSYATLPAANCGPICSLSNFEMEFVACISQQSAIVVFDFDYGNPQGLTFDLYNDEGEELGTWLYESLPVTLPAFEVNGAAPIVVTVCDHDNPDCCETFEVPAIDCNENNCEIFSVELDPQCTGNNFLVHMDFGYDNPASDSFTVMGNNLNYGTFAYSELPVTLGPLNGNTNINWEFNIEDTGTGTCGTTAVLGIYHCPPPCAMQSLEALALECNGNEAFALQIGLDIEGEGDNGFAVFSETAYYGSYMYDELPVTLPAFEVSGNFIDYVSVCDNDNIGCCTTTPFEALLCSGCLIYNLTATPLPCNSEDEIFVQINFDYQNQSMEGFEVSGNGNNYGQFAYEDLPIQIGPFVGDGSQYFEFVVTDLVNSLCFEAVEMGFIDCDTICELTNLVVETGDCTGNNTYVAQVDFDYQGVGGVGFDVFVNGEYFDTYSYGDLPITIEDFPSNGTGTDTVTVVEDGNELCFATLAFDAPDCQCNIYDMTTEQLDCTSDSTFAVSIEFFYENLNGDLVDVFLDGVIMGTYSVTEIPLVVTLPEGDGTGVLSVCANDISGCCEEQVIELLICETPQCGITELFAETGDCNSDSTFVLDFDFEYDNLPTDSVTVTANGNYVGQYQISPTFNRIEQFPIQDADTTTIVVCAVGAPDCCDSYSFVTPDCSFFGQCRIWDLVVDAGDCNSDSTYVLYIDFNSQNLEVDSVTVSANGNFIGQFEVTEEPLQIEQFPAFEDPITTLIVCAAGDPECCDTLMFETQDCSLFGQCLIWDIAVQTGDCQSDTTFTLFVSFNSQNLPTDSVEVTANGNPLGQFQVTGGNFVIEQFPVFETTITEMTICAVGDADCCATHEFETPNCEGGGTCLITDLVADPGDCTSDSTYNLFIDYFNVNLPLDSVTVTANEQFIGTYPHQSSGFTIENFPVFDANNTVITVCALGAPDCCDVFEFETPNCEGALDCHIFDLVADPGACNGDSTYTLFILYESANLPGDSVVVTTPEGYSATFVHQPGGFMIPDFPAYNTSHTSISVCAQGAPDCCDDFEFLTPDCGQEFVCEIYGLIAETGDCTSDSTYVVDIVFTGYNLPTDSVDIFANDQYLGAFFDDPEFIHIENFPHLPGESTVITVCAQGAGECCASFVIETPACGGDCSIFDILVDPNVCNSDSTFALLVNYQFQNLPGAGIDAYAGDQYLGFYPTSQIPFEIPNFPSNETGNYVLTLCESDGETCCSTIEFTGPVCGSGACSIFNLEYTITECDSAGQFYFILDFDFANTGNEGFNVVGNGNEYGNFSYEQVPVQIGPFPTDNTVFEFLVFDTQNPQCFDVVEPGDVDCFVSTLPVDFDAFFNIINNGSIPSILAKNNIRLSLYNANGKNILSAYPLSIDDMYTLQYQPAGMYIANVVHGSNTWTVKLIKSGN